MSINNGTSKFIYLSVNKIKKLANFEVTVRDIIFKNFQDYFSNMQDKLDKMMKMLESLLQNYLVSAPEGN